MPDGAVLIVLWACLESPTDQAGFMKETDIAERAGLLVSEVRDCLEDLARDSFVTLVRVEDGYKVYLEAKGRLYLRQRRDFRKDSGASLEPGAEALRSFGRSVASMRAGAMREVFARRGLLAYSAFISAVGVPALFVLWSSLNPSYPQEPPPLIPLEANSPVDGAVYDPDGCDSEAQEERERYTRLKPLKQLCNSLRPVSNLERGWSRVLVIQSQKFEKPYRDFTASTVYAKAPDDRGNSPICFAFLVSEESNASVLRSLCPIPQNISGASNYWKFTYRVPPSRANDRLVVIIGISQLSYEFSKNSEKDTPSKDIAFRIKRD